MVSLSQMHDWIVEIFNDDLPVAESMERLIDLCERERPHPDWAMLRELPYAELSPLAAWIENVFRNNPSDQALRGLWFGLFNPCHDGHTTVADINVCGSERFHAFPGDNSWAVWPYWAPKTSGARSQVLANIYRIAYRDVYQLSEDGRRVEYAHPDGHLKAEQALMNDAEFPLCLGYGAFAAREILRQISQPLILGESDSLGVAVGFDSGDFILIGRLISDGLIPLIPDSAPPEVSFESVVRDFRSSDRKKGILAMWKLRQFGDRAREVVPELIHMVHHARQFGLRQSAVGLLAEIAPDDPRTKAALLNALNDSSPFVRSDALQGIASIVELSADDLVRIKDMENDPDERVAKKAGVILRNIS